MNQIDASAELIAVTTTVASAEDARRLAQAVLEQRLAGQGITDATPSDVSRAICDIRREKLPDPAELGNAGSFFKNPLVSQALAAELQGLYPDLVAYPQADGQMKLAAGWLIEHAGWKGKNLGPVGMYEKQALVLVNRGGATGADVTALMHAVQRDVRSTFGVTLTPEPIFI